MFTLEKNPRFTAFLDSNLHTRLAIVTENELGLAFPPRNLPKKFRPDPSTFYLVIVVTNKQADRQTNRQTNAGDYIIPREIFAGIIIYHSLLILVVLMRMQMESIGNSSAQVCDISQDIDLFDCNFLCTGILQTVLHQRMFLSFKTE